MGALDDLFHQIEDEPIPGGCDRCDAYQIMREVSPGIYTMTVAHDDWCPFLRARESAAN